MAKMPPVQVIVVDEATLRRIIREELAARPAPAPEDGGLLPLPVPPGNAAAVDPPSSAWQPIEHIDIKQGTFTRRIALGNPVSVVGLGKGKQTGHGYTVQNIEVRPLVSRWTPIVGDDLENVNVTVQKGREPARIVKLSRIIYKRPKATS